MKYFLTLAVIVAIYLLGIMAFTTGCQSPRNVQRLGERYEIFQGVRAAAADLKDGNKQLDVFLGLEGEEERRPGDPFPEVVYCKAWNPEEKVLVQLAELINGAPSDKMLYIYGKRFTKKYKQYYGGLDCIIYAVGVWKPKAQKHIYLDAAYGEGWREGKNWLDFVAAVMKGGKKAVEVVTP